jgi:hypothetical protein
MFPNNSRAYTWFPAEEQTSGLTVILGCNPPSIKEFQMNKQLLASTAVCVVLGTAAFAQSPNNSTTNSPTAAQPQTSTPSSSSSSTTTQPSSSTQSTTTSTQGAPATGSTAQNQPSNSTTSQSAPAANPTTNQSAPAASTSPSQAQGNPPASTQPSGSSPPSQAQTNPPANNQAQQTPNSGNANTNAAQPAQSNTNTAQHPAQSNQPNTAKSSSTNVNASVNINDQQRTRLSQSFARVNVQPLNNVNFSVSVGTVIPRDLRLHPLPADVVEVVPQYRGYNFVMVRDEIVIVDPATYKIVTVLPRSGSGTAAAPASSRSKATFTDRDRDVVRRHTRASTERRTTGSSGPTRVEIRRGERVPDTVEIEEFPETVYREAPALREYRYIHRDNRTYVVEPSERRVIEEID